MIVYEHNYQDAVIKFHDDAFLNEEEMEKTLKEIEDVMVKYISLREDVKGTDKASMGKRDL